MSVIPPEHNGSIVTPTARFVSGGWFTVTTALPLTVPGHTVTSATETSVYVVVVPGNTLNEIEGNDDTAGVLVVPSE